MVLIINKEASTSLVVQIILNELGISSFIARDGFEGLNECLDYKGEFEFAILDLSEIEAISYIKHRRRNIQCIGISERYDKKFVRKCKRAGFDDLIRMPISLESFKAKFHPLHLREQQLKPFLVYNHIPHFTFKIPEQTLNEFTVSYCLN